MERIVGRNTRLYWMGIAISLITLHHLSIYGAGTFFNVFRDGNLGVDVFFFLSSYGCMASLEKSTVVSFYTRRLQRLFPMYLFFLIVVLVLFFPLGDIEDFLLVIGVHISGLSVFLHDEIIAWYIPSTIVLYLLFPIISKIGSFMQSRLWLQMITLLCVLLIAPKLPIIMTTAFAMRIPIIALGVFLYINKDNEKTCLLLFAMAIIIGFPIRNLFMPSVVLPLVLYAIDKSNCKMPLKSCFYFLGKHSLELYLAQYIAIGTLFANRSYRILSDNLTVQWFFALCLTMLLATVMYWVQFLTWRLIGHERKN